jgi:cytoskeletal protein RodZ
MESIGEKFKNTRVDRGCSIEQVARDTHIAKRYIIAIEEEDFSVFPGEPYLFGFLRNYANYLDLDAQGIINLYKNLRLQEQPAPINELLVKRNNRPYIIGGIVAAAAVLVVLGIIFLLPRIPRRPIEEAVNEQPEMQGETIVLRDEILEQPFNVNDIISIPVGGDYYSLFLSDVGEELLIETPSGDVSIAVNEEQRLDLDADGSPDIRLLLRSIEAEGDEASVIIRLDRMVQSPIAEAADADEEPQGGVLEADRELVIGGTTEIARLRQPEIILEVDEREDFTVEIEFSGNCLFRSETDGRARQERYFSAGELFKTSVRNSFSFWASNAGVMRTRVAAVEVRVGSQGEVRSGRISWVEQENGDRYRIQLTPMY